VSARHTRSSVGSFVINTVIVCQLDTFSFLLKLHLYTVRTILGKIQASVCVPSLLLGSRGFLWCPCFVQMSSLNDLISFTRLVSDQSQFKQPIIHSYLLSCMLFHNIGIEVSGSDHIPSWKWRSVCPTNLTNGPFYPLWYWVVTCIAPQAGEWHNAISDKKRHVQITYHPSGYLRSDKDFKLHIYRPKKSSCCCVIGESINGRLQATDR
jgi:hypothetical protein